MPPIPSDARLDQAVLKSVKDGLYPEDEEVLSAELPSSALSHLEKLLQGAREEVESSIRELSRLSAPDIDGWISQAKQLRTGVKTSEVRSNEIVALGKEGQQLAETENDTAGKVSFLKDELAFYDSLAAALDLIQSLNESLGSAQEAAAGNQLLDAIGFLKKVQADLEDFKGHQSTVVGGLLADKAEELKHVIVASLTRHWNGIVQIDQASSKMELKLSSEGSDQNLDAVVRGLSAVGLLRDYIVSLAKVFTNVILVPYIQQRQTKSTSSFAIGDDSIELLQNPSQPPGDFLPDLSDAIHFPLQRLPTSIARPLGELIIMATTSHLVSNYLPSVVPSDLGGIQAFQAELSKVTNFGSSLGKLSPQTSQPIFDWVSSAPKLWFARRSESSLNSIRQLLKRGLGSLRSVERVETQVVSNEDDVFTARDDNGDTAADDDWNADWKEDAEHEPEDGLEASATAPANDGGSHEGDDVGWGFDEQEPEPEKQEGQSGTAGEDEDVGDAWGWGGEEQSAAAVEHEKPSVMKSATTPQTNGKPRKQPAKARAEKTITLRETYHITAVPEQILEIVIMAIDDAERLSSKGLQNPIAPAAQDLSALPESLLAFYRAIAPNFYGHDTNANMLIYNDSLYMSEQLRSFMEHRQNRASNVDLASLEMAPSELSAFGKRSYSKEMESQRTILHDLLDGAQGFTNCAETPFAQQCDLAISSAIDRVKAVHAQWAPVLSRSALLQSIGSLLGTVTSKIIVDVGDMGDISEPESQRLVELCNRVLELDSLFLPDRPPEVGDSEPLVPLTAAYTPSWLRFQYLVNILESSLVDIKFLWTEGELSLEFSADEVVDLVEALFTDSDHRRRAVAEIRRGARHG